MTAPIDLEKVKKACKGVIEERELGATATEALLIDSMLDAYYRIILRLTRIIEVQEAALQKYSQGLGWEPEPGETATEALAEADKILRGET